MDNTKAYYDVQKLIKGENGNPLFHDLLTRITSLIAQIENYEVHFVKSDKNPADFDSRQPDPSYKRGSRILNELKLMNKDKDLNDSMNEELPYKSVIEEIPQQDRKC